MGTAVHRQCGRRRYKKRNSRYWRRWHRYWLKAAQIPLLYPRGQSDDQSHHWKGNVAIGTNGNEQVFTGLPRALPSLAKTPIKTTFLLCPATMCLLLLAATLRVATLRAAALPAAAPQAAAPGRRLTGSGSRGRRLHRQRLYPAILRTCLCKSVFQASS